MSRLLDIINGERARIELSSAKWNPRVPATVQYRLSTNADPMYVVRLGLIADPLDSVDVLEERNPRLLGRTLFEAVHGRRYTELKQFSFGSHPDLAEGELLIDGIVRYHPLTRREEHAVLRGYANESRRVLKVNEHRR